MSEELKILIVEDMPSDVELVVYELRKAGLSFVYRTLDTQDAYMEALTEFGPDIILSDYSMPRFDGMSALKILRERNVDIPFIVVTGSLNEETAVECMKAGATDYLIKEHLRRLGQAVLTALDMSLIKKEKAKTEQALHESLEIYRIITGYMTDAVWLTDLDFKVIFCTPSLERSLGYTLDELRAIPANQLLESTSLKAISDEIEDTITRILRDSSKDLRRSFEIEAIRKDGSKFWCDISITLVRDTNGSPVHFVCSGRDVTKRRKAQQALKESEERYRTLVENATEAIVVAQDFKLKFINPSAIRLTGYSEEELLSMPFTECIHPDDRATVAQNYARRMAGDEVPPHYDFRMLRKDGTIRWAEINAVRIVWKGEPATLNILTDVTERKAMTDALRDYTEFLEVLIDTMPNPIFYKDSEGRYQGCNLAFADLIMGMPKEGIIGKTVFELDPAIPKEHALEYHQKDLDLMKGGGFQIYDEQVKCSDKAMHRYVFYKAVYRNAKAEPAGIVGTMLDITERERMEKDLRESQYQLSIRSTIADIFLMHQGERIYDDILKVILEITRSRHGFIGYLDESGDLVAPTLLGEGWDECEMQDKRYRFPENTWGDAVWAKAIREKKEIILNDEGSVPLGHMRVRNALAIPFIFNDVPIGVICVANREGMYDETDKALMGRIANYIAPILGARLDRDEQENKRIMAEKQIYRLAAALEQSPEGISMCDLEGAILYTNPAWAAMHGYDTREAIGKNINIFYPEDQAPGPGTSLLTGIVEREAYTERVNHICKDKTILPTLTTTFLLKDSQEAPIAIISFARDITDELKLQSQLAHAQKMEAIGQLVGGIAHDFNNMLTPILGYTELALSERDTTPNIREHFEHILKSAERSRDLIRQLLAFSRKQILELKAIDLVETVKAFHSILRRTIRENITITIRSDASKGIVIADPVQINQILLNLAVNAQDAITGSGTISIEVDNAHLDDTCSDTHPDLSPGEYVVMSFNDTGCGMDSATRDHIFEPFFTTKERGKGTGLGLSTVFGIVKQHGGAITAYSEPGMGTAFKIYLPVASVEMKPVKKAPSGKKNRLTGTETIAVMEDDPMVRSLTCRVLSVSGYTILTGDTVEQIIREIEAYKGHIHLFLTDVILPGKNGHELYMSLKTQHPEMKVLYMSGYPDNLISSQGIINLGPNFIQKPFTLHDLTSKVRHVLDGEG